MIDGIKRRRQVKDGIFMFINDLQNVVSDTQ